MKNWIRILFILVLTGIILACASMPSVDPCTNDVSQECVKNKKKKGSQQDDMERLD